MPIFNKSPERAYYYLCFLIDCLIEHSVKSATLLLALTLMNSFGVAHWSLVISTASTWAIVLFILLSGNRDKYELGDSFLPGTQSSPVALHMGNTLHYNLNDDAEWQALVPHNNHTIRLGRQVYTPRILHQMKCLDILRTHYLGPQLVTPPPLIRHCMQYIRQMVYCQSNSRLESVHSTRGSADREYEAVCEDWESIYAAIEKARNQNIG
ncbi:hypothetical protein DL96DRAFT_1536301 [Flagelloscypha sp. PMI_526]|nr:hypothetical protein DL96DRAFT_1536301 [Flagelloscypha sp. PMI_526]